MDTAHTCMDTAQYRMKCNTHLCIIACRSRSDAVCGFRWPSCAAIIVAGRPSQLRDTGLDLMGLRGGDGVGAAGAATSVDRVGTAEADFEWRCPGRRGGADRLIVVISWRTGERSRFSGSHVRSTLACCCCCEASGRFVEAADDFATMERMSRVAQIHATLD
jgi:hypothetical protein